MAACPSDRRLRVTPANHRFPGFVRTELYPEIQPHRTGRLALDERHVMYWEESGNPRGVPVRCGCISG